MRTLFLAVALLLGTAACGDDDASPALSGDDSGTETTDSTDSSDAPAGGDY